jgi:hypothetical protein
MCTVKRCSGVLCYSGDPAQHRSSKGSGSTAAECGARGCDQPCGRSCVRCCCCHRVAHSTADMCGSCFRLSHVGNKAAQDCIAEARFRDLKNPPQLSSHLAVLLVRQVAWEGRSGQGQHAACSCSMRWMMWTPCEGSRLCWTSFPPTNMGRADMQHRTYLGVLKLSTIGQQLLAIYVHLPHALYSVEHVCPPLQRGDPCTPQCQPSRPPVRAWQHGAASCVTHAHDINNTAVRQATLEALKGRLSPTGALRDHPTEACCRTHIRHGLRMCSATHLQRCILCPGCGTPAGRHSTNPDCRGCDFPSDKSVGREQPTFGRCFLQPPLPLRRSSSI